MVWNWNRISKQDSLIAPLRISLSCKGCLYKATINYKKGLKWFYILRSKTLPVSHELIKISPTLHFTITQSLAVRGLYFWSEKIQITLFHRLSRDLTCFSAAAVICEWLLSVCRTEEQADHFCLSTTCRFTCQLISNSIRWIKRPSRVYVKPF